MHARLLQQAVWALQLQMAAAVGVAGQQVQQRLQDLPVVMLLVTRQYRQGLLLL
jgi:hypothetical protein